MDLALKHQNQFVVLSGTEEHLVMLILILLYRSWNIKYILSIMLHNQCYQFFYAKRLSQCFNHVFSEWYFLSFAPSMSALHHCSTSRFYATHVCSSEVQAVLINNEVYYTCIRLTLDNLIAYETTCQQAHFTTGIRPILAVCSAYHSESTFPSVWQQS